MFPTWEISQQLTENGYNYPLAVQICDFNCPELTHTMQYTGVVSCAYLLVAIIVLHSLQSPVLSRTVKILFPTCATPHH